MQQAQTTAATITDPTFAYVTAASTDVTRTFKKHGWTEPDRDKQRAMKRLLNQLDNIDDLDAQLASARL
ncbi:hypothetical protein [Massilia sp. TN1-12]|uniref:hypothetical protein n=1 Tax=Massilia paldalensis TaxID=3377675 RepID=UPI00384D5DFF